MEVFECIKTRRSVRRFEDRPVERETKNSQTPRYTVVDKREIIDDIAENGCCDFAFNTKTLKQTPVLIVVSYVKGICGFEKDGSYSTDKKEGWQMFDAGVAAQTFALAAHAQGVGTVMLGIYDAAYIQEKLGIPQTEEVAVLLAAGYEKFTPDAPTRKTAEDVLRFV